MTAKAVVNLAVEIHDTAALGILQRYLPQTTDAKGGLRGLSDLFLAAASGGVSGLVIAHIDGADGTAAASTLTVTQANATAGDTVTVAGVVFTCTGSSTPSTNPADGEFKAITSDAVAAAALQAAIAAHPKLKGVVVASLATNVVTVTCDVKTPVGNAITLASSDGTFVAVGAAKLASGATGTTVTGGGARCYRFGGA